MTETFYLVPAPGRRVLDPLTFQPLPATGAGKPQTTYWLRRLRDGDVALGTSPAGQGGDSAAVGAAEQVASSPDVPFAIPARAGKRGKVEPER